MPLTRDDARPFARTTEILTGEEMPRADHFLDLMVESARHLAEDPEDPSCLEWVMARSIAAMLWRYDRETSDGDALRRLVLSEPSYNLARANQFRDADGRVRLQRVYREGIEGVLETLNLVRNSLRQGASSTRKTLPFRKRDA